MAYVVLNRPEDTYRGVCVGWGWRRGEGGTPSAQQYYYLVNRKLKRMQISGIEHHHNDEITIMTKHDEQHPNDDHHHNDEHELAIVK